MEKRPINATLRGMNVGDVELFPLSQYTSVRSSKYAGALLEDRANGADWDIRPDLAGKVVVVTRTA